MLVDQAPIRRIEEARIWPSICAMFTMLSSSSSGASAAHPAASAAARAHLASSRRAGLAPREDGRQPLPMPAIRCDAVMPQHHRPQHEQQREHADQRRTARSAQDAEVGLAPGLQSERLLRAGAACRRSAKRMLTTSTWSPRFRRSRSRSSPGGDAVEFLRRARLPACLPSAPTLSAIHHHRQADAVDLRLLVDQRADGLADFVVGGFFLPWSCVPAAVLRPASAFGRLFCTVTVPFASVVSLIAFTVCVLRVTWPSGS